LDDHAFSGKLFLQQIRLVLVASQDSIRVTKQAVRPEQDAEHFSPFPPTVDLGVETAPDFFWQVENTAMNRNDKREAALLSNRQGDASNSPESVSVYDGQVALTP
jgi:hypothetical protein